MNTRIWLAIAFALPVTAFAVSAVAIELRDQFDPCFIWGDTMTYNSGTYNALAGGVCAGRVGHIDGRTRTRAIGETLAIPGVILVAAALGIYGAARRRPRILLVAACLMAIEGPPTMFSLMPLALLAAAGFAYLGKRISEASSTLPQIKEAESR